MSEDEIKTMIKDLGGCFVPESRGFIMNKVNDMRKQLEKCKVFSMTIYNVTPENLVLMRVMNQEFGHKYYKNVVIIIGP